MADALRQAFSVMLDAADPATAATALRAGLRTLLRSGSFKGVAPAISDRVPAAAEKAPRRQGRSPRPAAPTKPNGRHRGRPPKARPNGAAPAETGLTPNERARLGFLHSAGRARSLGPTLLQTAIDGGALTPGDVVRVKALLAG